MVQPRDGFVREGNADVFVKVVEQRRKQRLVDQRAFAASADATDTHQTSQRDFDIDLLQVVAAGAFQDEVLAVAFSALLGHSNGFDAVQVLRRDGIGVQMALGWPLNDDLAAVDAGAWADVDEVVGGEHHVFVVLDDDHRVACIAKGTKAVNEFSIVPLVKPNARLVKNVKDLGEAASNLGGQTDALGFAAADAARGPVQAQVAQPHVQQKAQPRAHFFQWRACNRGLTFRELGLQVFEERRQLVKVHAAKLSDVASSKPKLQARGFESRAVAGGAGDFVHERLRPTSQGDGLGFFGRANNGRHKPFKGHGAATDAAAVLQLDVPVGAVQDLTHDLLRDLAHGCGQRQVVRGQNGFHNPRGQVVLQLAERRDPALLHAHTRIRNQRLGVHLRDLAKPIARGACPIRAVEAEKVGLGLGVGESRGGAHEVARKVHGRVAVEGHDRHGTFAQRQGGLHRLQNALRVLGPHHNPVHDGLNVMHLVAVDLVAGLEFHELAVDAGAEVAQAHDLLKQLPVVAFSASDHGGEQQEFLAFEAGEDVVRDLVVRVPHHGFAGLEGKRVCGPGVQQPQKVMELGHRADRGPRVLRNGFLLDGHHGTQARNGLHIGALQSAQKLTRIRTQRFQKPPLSLGVERVEREARLAASTDPREHHEFVPRKDHIHVFEVVLRRTGDNQIILSGVGGGMRGHAGSTIGPHSGSPLGVALEFGSKRRTFQPNPATSMVIRGDTQLKMQ